MLEYPTPIQSIKNEITLKAGVSLFIKRDDLIHPLVSGNKFRKLKYTLAQANNKTLVTFGGAYSNHIFALAAAAKLNKLNSIGIIRGNELNENSSPTLQFATKQGMKLIFVSRVNYKNKEELVKDYDLNHHLIVPEGGTSPLALQGVSEVIDEINLQGDFTHVCTAVGTGGTAAGLLFNQNLKSEVIGFSALKNGSFLKEDIEVLLGKTASNFNLQTEYHFGGYAKYNEQLLNFIIDFESQHQIPLEQVYTAKMAFGTLELIKKGYFAPNSKILMLHTGGLQGRLKSLPPHIEF